MKTKVGDSILVCISGTPSPHENPAWIWRPERPLIVEAINPDGTVVTGEGSCRGVRSWIRVASLAKGRS